MRNVKCAVNVRAHFNCAHPINWIESKIYKITRNSYQYAPTSKFAADGIPTDLAKKLAPHLEPINYDRWAELEFKDQLTDEEMKEKQALEKKNLATIEKVYQRLRNDKEIQAQIERIKAHPWVRVVEGR